MIRGLLVSVGALGLAACSGSTSTLDAGSGRFKGEAWADNWFSLSIGDKLIAEDSVPITTERSFNAETFSFEASYPMVLAFVLKDFKQNDTGLEYIGAANQQMGDGGFIFQLTDTTLGKVVHGSSAAWRCKVIHKAPTNKTCAKDTNPEKTCLSVIENEPDGWRSATYDDSAWSTATEYTEAAVSPKDGYTKISWSPAAKLIWTADLQTDNTLLCRTRVSAP